MIKDDIDHDEVILKFLKKQRKRIKKIRTKCNGKKECEDKKDKETFELHVVIRDEALVLSDNHGGIIKTIPKVASGHNYQMLTSTLKQVKARFPDKTNATILSEQKISQVDLSNYIIDDSKEVSQTFISLTFGE